MARTRIPSDFIDLGIGEPHFLREAVTAVHDVGSFRFDEVPRIWEYAPPHGYDGLVRLLEERHGAPVVVTIGAKHGIFAALHALHQEGVRSVSYRSPYWASFPFMMERAGMRSVTDGGDADANLLVMPNNPDGFMTDLASARAAGRGKPLIHDAAYYTKSYFPAGTELGAVGDMQVFSASKMYGLSGLRLGWVVCHERRYRDVVAGFVEATTAGVSTASQRVLMSIVAAEQRDPSLQDAYATKMREHLAWAQAAIRTIDEDVLMPVSTSGMFGWCRKGPKFNAEAAKVAVMEGAAFGDASMVRLNLAVPAEQLERSIERLNRLRER